MQCFEEFNQENKTEVIVGVKDLSPELQVKLMKCFASNDRCAVGILLQAN